MSPPPLPGIGDAVRAMARLAWLRTLRGRKLRLAVMATLLVVGAASAARYAADASEPARVVERACSVGFFGLLVYLVPFLFASGAIAEEVEARTFTYLALRPSGRIALALGKYVVASGASILVLGSGVLLLHVAVFLLEPASMIEELAGTVRILGAIGALALAYSAICLFWGSLVTQAGGILAAVHLATLEFGGSLAPWVFRFVSLNHFATRLGGLPEGGVWAESVPDVEPWVAGTVVGCATLAFLALAAWVVKAREIGRDD